MKALSIDKKRIKNIVQWLLAAATLLMIVSGYGISEFRIVEGLTFGIISKSTAFAMHDALAMPFIVLVVLHVILAIKK